MSKSENCPCGRSTPYNKCCGAFIDGKTIPETAEELMRSRYSAYTRQNDDYLLETWHPSTRPDEKPSDDDSTIWTKLEILRTEKGLNGDKDGVVEFLAQCNVKGTASHIHETSNFLYEDGRWYYVDAQTPQPVRRDTPKVGRNDSCPCGSNKKYKKCCGK